MPRARRLDRLPVSIIGALRQWPEDAKPDTWGQQRRAPRPPALRRRSYALPVGGISTTDKMSEQIRLDGEARAWCWRSGTGTPLPQRLCHRDLYDPFVPDGVPVGARSD